MQERLDGGQVAAAGIELEVPARRARVKGDLRAVAIPVSLRTSEREPEEVVIGQSLGRVLEDEGGPVEVIDHEVQVAVSFMDVADFSEYAIIGADLERIATFRVAQAANR